MKLVREDSFARHRNYQNKWKVQLTFLNVPPQDVELTVPWKLMGNQSDFGY